MAGVPYCQNLIWFYGTREDGISFRPERIAQPPCADFHLTYKFSTALCADLLCQISLRSSSECANCRHNSTHARKQSMAFTAPCNWPHYVEISYTEFHPKAANIRQGVYRSMYAFNRTVPVPQSTERLLGFLHRI